MPEGPEDDARQQIDAALQEAGWVVQDGSSVNLSAGPGVAVRQLQMEQGHGEADYVLFVDGVAAGVVEAKPVGTTLTGVEQQTMKYSEGFPDDLPAADRPLPFLYQSTGVETRFTNLWDPDYRSRRVFHFHQPAEFRKWIDADALSADEAEQDPALRSDIPSTLRARLRTMPPPPKTKPEGLLWDNQHDAIKKLERSLANGRQRSLIQMATGSGKTFTAITSIYRLIKHAGANRVLFLVDRNNLGRQAHKEFQDFDTPPGRKFTDEYNVNHLQSNHIDPVNKVVISTIQRLYSILKGEEEYEEENEEKSGFEMGDGIGDEPAPVAYNTEVPIEFFDVIFIDECHRSIYNLWKQVLDYFDAFLIGLTATPSKETYGFFDQNAVMEYDHEEAVADNVNVDFDVYRIRTEITEQGSHVDAGHQVKVRDKRTREERWQTPDEPVTYEGSQLDRDVVAPDQIRTVIEAFKDRLQTEIFPDRDHVPKTLIYAKDDQHADDIVQIVREVFGKGNKFCKKVTYRTGHTRVVEKKELPDGEIVEKTKWKRTSAASPEEVISEFRNSFNPRIVVTVDMISTGTDIKPLEVVMFLRSVKSRTYFEQMKGRGVRIIDEGDLRSVTPDADAKTHFVLVDCVGVTESEMQDSQPMDRQKSVSFEKLMDAVALGNRDEEVLSSLASRLSRFRNQCDEEEIDEIEEVAEGETMDGVIKGLVDACDPDKQIERAREIGDLDPDEEPPEDLIEEAAEEMREEAAEPLAANPKLRHRIQEVKSRSEQIIDVVSMDTVIEAGYDEEARDRIEKLTEKFETFVEDRKDELDALQLIYNRNYQGELHFEDLKRLQKTLVREDANFSPDLLWECYRRLDEEHVEGKTEKDRLTDLISLIRYALGEQTELKPYPELVHARFDAWLQEQQEQGREFTDEQMEWLEEIRDHIAESLEIQPEDLQYAPFVNDGGLARAKQLFGDELGPMLEELNEELVV